MGVLSLGGHHLYLSFEGLRLVTNGHWLLKVAHLMPHSSGGIRDVSYTEFNILLPSLHFPRNRNPSRLAKQLEEEDEHSYASDP